MGSWDRKDMWQGSGWRTEQLWQWLADWDRQGGGWRTMQSHLCMQINWEEQLVSKTECATQGSGMGKEIFKTSGCKRLWGLWQWEKLPVSQESLLEGSTGS